MLGNFFQMFEGIICRHCLTQNTTTMKNQYLFFVILSFISLLASGQKQCDIQKHYEDFITVGKETHNNRSYISKSVIEAPKKSCYSSVVNNCLDELNYILTNFTSNQNYQHILDFTDSLDMRKAFFEKLITDSTFNSIMLDFANKSINKSIPKDTITMSKLLNIAVKYFSIIKITDEGYYVGKICIGMNDIKKTEAVRQPFVEAFCFSSILKNCKKDEYGIYDEFMKNLKELYKVNLGIDKDEKLLRSQGALYFIMRNNEILNQLLRKEYDRQKDNLPFVLVDK